MGNEVDRAINVAYAAVNPRESAQLFELSIGDILRTVGQKDHKAQAHWTRKLAKFISKLYPLVTTSLRLMSAFGEV